MRIVIHPERCVGHARCHHVAPALYPLDDNGYNTGTGFTVPPGQEALARRGARACPERAIEILDDPVSEPTSP